MSEFKNISINELKEFKGTVCLYSLKRTENLGVVINESFKNLFEYGINYLDSLAKESLEDLILIDGDDFNASKIFGLTKKYTAPIVIFISNVDKLNKIKELLLRHILIIDKNSMVQINIDNNVEENIKNKELKDAQKLLEQSVINIEPTVVEEDTNKVPEVLDVNKEIVSTVIEDVLLVNIPSNKEDKKEESIEIIEYKSILMKDLKNFNGSICLFSLKEEEGLGINVKNTFKYILKGPNIIYKNSLAMESSEDLILIDGDDFNASKIFGLTKKYTAPIVIFISNVDKLNKIKELLLRNVLIIDKNLIIEINIENDIKENIKNKELRDAQKLLEKNKEEKIEEKFEKEELTLEESTTKEIKEISFEEEFKDKFNFDRVYHNTNSVFIMDSLKNIFNKEFTFLPFFSNKIIEFDFLVLDLNYCSLSRLYEWFEILKPCPMIIMGYRKNSLESITKFLNRNILRIEKPFDLTESELKEKIRDYLNSYQIEEENKPLDRAYDPKIGIPKEIYDNEEQGEIRVNFNKNEFRNEAKKTREEKIQYTKDVINASNQRTDKSFSLKELYKKFELDALAVFDSKLNKCIYTTYEGKVITYSPEGYFIEYRIEKLKNKGLSSKELNSALERLEEADIRFQQKKLKKIDDYQQLKNEKNKIEQPSENIITSKKTITAVTEDRKELFIERYSDKKKAKNKELKVALVEDKKDFEIEKYSDKKKINTKDIINKTIKDIQSKFSKIDFNIFAEFSEFVLNYRLLRKNFKTKKAQEKEELQKRIIEEQKKKKEELELLKLKEKKNDTKYNLLSDIQISDREKMKQLRAKASAENSNNDEENNIKHNKSKVLLSELNNKLNEKALYDRVITNKVEKIDKANEEKLESTFKDAKFRPPRKNF